MRGQLGLPASVRTGGGSGLERCELDRDLGARIGPAPDRHGHVALQDHVVAKHRGQAKFGLRGTAENSQRTKK